MSAARRSAGSGRRAATRAAIVALLGAWLLLAGAGPGLAASPSPSTGAGYGGDTRTSGQGPGLEGSPLYALGGVLAVALISIAVTVLYVRATGGGAPSDGSSDDPATH